MANATATVDRLDGELDGLGAGIAILEILIADPDLDPTGADVARFYRNRLLRRQRELLLAADLATIAAEGEGDDHDPD